MTAEIFTTKTDVELALAEMGLDASDNAVLQLVDRLIQERDLALERVKELAGRVAVLEATDVGE